MTYEDSVKGTSCYLLLLGLLMRTGIASRSLTSSFYLFLITESEVVDDVCCILYLTLRVPAIPTPSYDHRRPSGWHSPLWPPPCPALCGHFPVPPSWFVHTLWDAFWISRITAFESALSGQETTIKPTNLRLHSSASRLTSRAC